jgi:iodotyrosine deiodinase
MSDTKYPSVALQFERRAESTMLEEARRFIETMRSRRSVRSFASDPVPRGLIECAITAANSAPSGANRQPWHFSAVSDPTLKAEIRLAAEKEEREFYEGGRATDDWLNALEPLGTNWRKPFLETAPWLVAVFKQIHGISPDGEKITNYYVNESVGIACGLFIAALHTMGLATLTHTPAPMRFLGTILERPANERPFILFPIGYPAADCHVPDIEKKSLDQVSSWFV